MTVARVVGNVWATKKHKALESLKLLLVQTVNVQTGEVMGRPQMALDKHFGAGPGDTVLVVDEGGAARQILGIKSAPVRLVVCGIVDSVSVGRSEYRYH